MIGKRAKIQEQRRNARTSASTLRPKIVRRPNAWTASPLDGQSRRPRSLKQLRPHHSESVRFSARAALKRRVSASLTWFYRFCPQRSLHHAVTLSPCSCSSPHHPRDVFRTAAIGARSALVGRWRRRFVGSVGWPGTLRLLPHLPHGFSAFVAAHAISAKSRKIIKLPSANLRVFIE